MNHNDPWGIIDDPGGWWVYYKGKRYLGPFDSEKDCEEYILGIEQDHK